ncbi:MAG: hypothetical protein K940chlam9_01380 [Chlamydiae bacterium]|nr:hypothetical protein [Chlamydiota bacterium]
MFSALFPQPPIYIALEKSSGSTKVAVVTKKQKRWYVSLVKEVDSEEAHNLLYQLPKEGILLSALPTKEVLVRPFPLQNQKKKDLLATLDWQIEPLLPYPVDEAIVQGQISEKEEKGIALSVRKKSLSAHLEKLHSQKWEPEKITSIPSALASFSSLLPQSSLPLLLIHVGEEEVSCVFAYEGKILASRAIEKESQLRAEIEKTFLSFSAKHPDYSIETVCLLAEDPSYLEVIKQATGLPVFFPQIPTLNLSQEELLRYGHLIGMAIAAETSEIDFRRKEFAYPKPWRRVKKPLLTFFAFSFLLTASFLGWSLYSLDKEKFFIEKSYQALMKNEGKKEEQYAFLTTPEEYLESLYDLQKEIVKRTLNYPLYPKVPQAKEVLAWISSHPEVSGKEITIENFHYSLVSRPDPSNPKGHYKGKVEIEFSTSNPNLARNFHEAISKNNPLADPKEEVSWNPGRSQYKMSFYLKDQTPYAS